MSTNTLVFGLFEYDAETDGNLPFNITQALNNNWDKIDSLVFPSAAAAAPYNPSGTYNVGDYCIYNGTLQICNTPIPSGETWNPAHWTNATLTQLLSPLGGATTAQAALAALGAGARPNELDNAYFVGGGTGWGVFPVNQRGISSTISTPGYFIDRWKLVSGTVQITAAGLVLNGTIEQILPSSIGSVYTATALTTAGLVTCQYDDASCTFTIIGTGQTFIFAKLERGVGQTAAYQDADGAWRLLPQPEIDYASQLEKCQQYFFPIVNNRDLYGSVSGAGDALLFTIDLPVCMRTIPAISGQSTMYVRSIKGQYGDFNPSNLIIYSVGGTQIKFECSNPDSASIPPGTPITTFFVNSIYLTAEL